MKNHIELIEKLEGFEAFSYVDTTGHRTVGYGFNMDSKLARGTWDSLNISTDFDSVYSGEARLSEESAYELFNIFWTMSEAKAKQRAKTLELDYNSFPEWKKFILADIVYNTGSIGGWYNVLMYNEPHDVLFEARRKQHEIDGRIAKIGYHFGLIKTLDEAHEIGLVHAKYLT